MKLYELPPPARQAGMTLLELTVVLLILIALAGMMIPSFDRSIVTSTENSTNVSSLAEVDKWMQSYNSIFMKEPNNMEALINGTAGTSATDVNCNATNAPFNAVYCKMIQPAYFGTATVNTAGSVDADKQRALSLTMAGITSVYYNDPNTTDATFNSTIAGDPTPIDDGSVHTLAKVVVPPGITDPIEVYLANVFGTTADKFDVTCYDYIAFGIGNGSSLTGKLMSSAPVQYIAESDAGPALRYNRFVAIYQVDKLAAEVNQGATNKGCSPGTESARYMGSVIAGDRYAGRLMGLVHTQGQTHKNIN